MLVLNELLKTYERPKTKITNQRQTIIKEFFDELTLERKFDNWRRFVALNSRRRKSGENPLTPEEFKKHEFFLKPLTPRGVAVMLAKVPQQDLYCFLSMCRDYKNRNGSFGKIFFGALKTK